MSWKKILPHRFAAASGIAWALIGVSALLSGCAQSVNAIDRDGEVIYTESDEPANVRRARVRMELASNYFQTGQLTVALDEVKQALALNPRLMDAHNLRGLIYMQMNEARLAEDSFRRALALRPNDGDTLHNLGWFYCQQKRHVEAASVFAQALATPGYAARSKTWMVQGLCEMQAGQPANAERSLQRASELDPQHPVINYNLALLAYQRQDWVTAQWILRKLNDTDFANAETLWLGVRVERKLDPSSSNVIRWGQQLQRRFGASKEALMYERRAFDE